MESKSVRKRPDLSVETSNAGQGKYIMRKVTVGLSGRDLAKNEATSPLKPAYRALLEAQANDSDSSSTRIKKKKTRKDMRRQVRLHRE